MQLLVWPKRNDHRVIERFGALIAEELLPIIKSLEADFYAPAPDMLARDLNEMGKTASERFREKPPDVSEEVVKMLVSRP
jgi:hypothetical protein